MPVFESRLNPRPKTSKAMRRRMLALVDDLHAQLAHIRLGGDRYLSRGKLHSLYNGGSQVSA
jgi:hypothetical protein